ncbi:MAG: hypothetical protein H5T73_02960 [Actinobacteria bacterium]|nr:hypothetical protein [Actinomycetota bacterium]
MKRISLILDDDALIWLKRVITDQDGEEASRFLNDEVLKPRTREAEWPSGLRRTFDAGGPPGQLGAPC